MTWWPFKRRVRAMPFEEQVKYLPPVPCGDRNTHYSWEVIDGMPCPTCQSLKEQRSTAIRDEALAERIAHTVKGVAANLGAKQVQAAASVLEEIIRMARPKEIVVSALGLREGLLYDRLSEADQKSDPLIVAARISRLAIGGGERKP